MKRTRTIVSRKMFDWRIQMTTRNNQLVIPLQRNRIQSLRNMKEYIKIMMKTEVSHIGTTRIIQQQKFISLMTEIENILSNLILKFNQPLSLRNFAKREIVLQNLQIQELPKNLQSEITNLYIDTMNKQSAQLELINSELKIVEKKYNEAFSINLTKCTLF